MERITPAQALLAIGSSLRRSKHNTRGNLSYKPGFFNRPGTKLVRKWYGEEAARRYNS